MGELAQFVDVRQIEMLMIKLRTSRWENRPNSSMEDRYFTVGGKVRLGRKFRMGLGIKIHSWLIRPPMRGNFHFTDGETCPIHQCEENIPSITKKIQASMVECGYILEFCFPPNIGQSFH